MIELERAIADDPARVDSYLVYADALQMRGDPRGELITLQHRQMLDVSDVHAADVARDFLNEHRVAFLGGLLEYAAEQYELDWYLGFVQRARLSFAVAAVLCDALRALLSLESARFLRRLELELPETKGRAARDQYREIIDILIEQGRPMTLSELSIGKPGEIVFPDGLYEAFPGLRRTPRELWRELDEAVSSQKRLKPEFDVERLPRLELRDRTAVGDIALSSTAIVRGLKAELWKKRPLGIVEKLRQLCTPESLDMFALGLATQWREMGEPAHRRWGFSVMGLVGGRHCVAFIGGHLSDWSHRRAVQGVDLLEQIGSNPAVHEIYALAVLPFGSPGRRDYAWATLDRIASRRGLDRERLIDRVVPVPVQVTGTARERAIAAQARRLEHLMLSGHRLSSADFRHYVLHHPLRVPLAERVLWGRYRGRHKLFGAFRVSERRSLLDHSGAPIQLTANEQIGVVHPAEISDEQRIGVWRVLFAESGVKKLFEQLDRPMFSLSDSEQSAQTLRRFSRKRVGFYPIQGGLESRGWRVFEESDGGGTLSWSKLFERDGLSVVAELGPTSGSIESVWIARDGWRRSKRTFGSLHSVTLSELLYDLDLAHSRRRPNRARSPGVGDATMSARGVDADKQARPLPQTGGYPFAERAKSGRSTCIVCGDKIAKGTVRIGVERAIETPTFRGHGTGWLHAACRDRCAELSSLDDLDGRLQLNSPGVWPEATG